MSLANKLFCRITGKSSSDESANQGTSRSKEMHAGSKNPDEVLKQFIAVSPQHIRTERRPPVSASTKLMLTLFCFELEIAYGEVYI